VKDGEKVGLNVTASMIGRRLSPAIQPAMGMGDSFDLVPAL
jgi:hypothetical protein